MQLDVVGAVSHRVEESVCLPIILVAGAVAALEIGLLLQDIDIDRLFDITEIVPGLGLELVGGVLGDVDIQRIFVGDGGQDDVDEDDRRDEQDRQYQRERAAARGA